MLGRENLKEEWVEDLDADTMVYDPYYANKVMDAMEAKINELETEIKKLETKWERWKDESNKGSLMVFIRDTLQPRHDELEDENKKLKAELKKLEILENNGKD